MANPERATNLDKMKAQKAARPAPPKSDLMATLRAAFTGGTMDLGSVLSKKMDKSK